MFDATARFSFMFRLVTVRPTACHFACEFWFQCRLSKFTKNCTSSSCWFSLSCRLWSKRCFYFVIRFFDDVSLSPHHYQQPSIISTQIFCAIEVGWQLRGAHRSATDLRDALPPFWCVCVFKVGVTAAVDMQFLEQSKSCVSSVIGQEILGRHNIWLLFTGTCLTISLLYKHVSLENKHKKWPSHTSNQFGSKSATNL